MKMSELKEMAIKELVERLQTEQDNLIRLRLNHSVSPLDNPLKIRDSRRNIARMQTMLHSREVK
jgi:large subunit ribosomal protein L29